MLFKEQVKPYLKYTNKIKKSYLPQNQITIFNSEN